MDGVLPLLPARGLDQSILLPVLVGMLVMLALTETLGWGFVGVVVPGYLASVLAIEPLTGLAIFAEALITLALARAAATLLSRAQGWTEFFGRDRFFLIVFISIVVRQHDHAWVFPWIAATFDGRFGTHVLLEQRFFSVGLVIVPLMANMFWKPARFEGLIKVSTIVLITWAVLEWVLLPHTNLSIGSFELTYENAALDFLGNAKAYIILLCTAYLGAAFNLRYGWDYNGILIPALLALLWLTPTKLFATLIESVLLLYAVRAALRLPGLRTANLEGPRKIAFVFSLAFGLKWLVGFALGDRFPGLHLTDVFAFGYLLSSLLAVRMLQRKTVRGVVLPALLTATTGFALGSVVGFGLEMLAPRAPVDLSQERRDRASTRLLRHPQGVLTLGRLRAADAQRGFSPLPASVRAGYGQAWAALGMWASRPTAENRAEAFAASARVGLSLRAFPLDRPSDGAHDTRPVHLLIESEAKGSRFGFELALIRPGAQGPALLFPHPASEGEAVDAAWRLCLAVDCPIVVVAGADTSLVRDEHETPEAHTASELLRLASVQLGELSRIEVRVDATLMSGESKLHVQAQTPPGVGGLNGLLPGLQLDWAPAENAALEDARSQRRSVLRAHPEDWLALVNAQAASSNALERRELSLDAFLAGDPGPAGNPAGAHSDGSPDDLAAVVDAPSRDDLRYIERLLTAPLVEALALRRSASPPRVSPRSGDAPEPLDPQLRQRLALIAHRASLIGFELVILDRCIADSKCVVLTDRRRPAARGWGTLVLRIDGTSELAVEIPRPQRATGTQRLGIDLWAASKASALLIAGADGPAAGFDADPSLRGNFLTPFQAFHQGMESTPGGPKLILQVRGIGAWRPIEQSLVVGMGRPLATREGLPRSLLALFEAGGALDWVGSWALADGSPELYSLSGAGVPQFEYSDALNGAQVVSLWFAESLRRKFKTTPSKIVEDTLSRLRVDYAPIDEAAVALPLGWRSVELSEADAPAGAKSSAAALEPLRRDFERGVTIAESYARSRNIHQLARLQTWLVDGSDTKRKGKAQSTKAAPINRQLRVGVGQSSGQVLLYLGIDDGRRRYGAFVKLTKELVPQDEVRVYLRPRADSADLLSELFDRSRSLLFLIERIAEPPDDASPPANPKADKQR